MHILYDETKQPFSGKVKYENLNATKHWTTHFGNYMYLKFIFSNSKDRNERQQASKEMLIADRKMNYWRRHPNWNMAEAATNKVKIEADWSSKSTS